MEADHNETDNALEAAALPALPRRNATFPLRPPAASPLLPPSVQAGGNCTSNEALARFDRCAAPLLAPFFRKYLYLLLEVGSACCARSDDNSGD